MSPYDNIYSAFMLDHASGSLPPAERLVADIHIALSDKGRRIGLMAAAIGGALLESVEPSELGATGGDPGQQRAAIRAASPLAPYLERDLMGLRWRRSIFGVKTAATTTPMAELLRLDPGERAPGHCHGRRDVTVVLTGSYADEFGVYQRGDLAFAEPGMRHTPRAEGSQPCVCLVATEAGRPLQGMFGLFGIDVSNPREQSS